MRVYDQEEPEGVLEGMWVVEGAPAVSRRDQEQMRMELKEQEKKIEEQNKKVEKLNAEVRITRSNLGMVLWFIAIMTIACTALLWLLNAHQSLQYLLGG